MDDRLIDRQIEIEIKVAHQDMAIEELKKTVFDQSLLIEKLENSVKKLTQQINAGAESIGPANEKPPHY